MSNRTTKFMTYMKKMRDIFSLQFKPFFIDESVPIKRKEAFCRNVYISYISLEVHSFLSMVSLHRLSSVYHTPLKIEKH